MPERNSIVEITLAVSFCHRLCKSEYIRVRKTINSAGS